MGIFEIIGAAIGLFYIVSEYRADRWFWPLSLLMSAFYAVIDFTSGIYANGAICCYNFVMSIYGILVWRGVIKSARWTTAVSVISLLVRGVTGGKSSSLS